ncbi:hypothetical protein O3Q52_01310 [Streptomyces sp. ActVer]|uniref:hypothetical protein n=1 Tax=Streptomyces sp. ActVer TaxID=3014558 RepID=UPI0022B49400|nr:hypothetical protein [Streptomyces sp. ActVer]MCZ4506865.1 hypothetical protein [Streptomyces sp. ActVer]
MRTLSRCLIPLLAAGCLAVTAGTSATASTASAVDAGAVAPAAPLPVPEPAPDPCAVDWPALAGLTDTGTLREAIVTCVESYTERDLDSWLQAPPKPPVEQMTQKEQVEQMAQAAQVAPVEKKEQGVTAVEDWTGADAADWDDDLACDLAEIFDEPTLCRPAHADPAP